jgi:hypothetical protein
MWSAWLIGKNETSQAVECQIEFRDSDDGAKVVRTIILDPVKDGISDQTTATNVLRQKVGVILAELTKVEQLGTLVQANIGAQILPLP